jgi:GNAT superfamily N-acetyltransferase
MTAEQPHSFEWLTPGRDAGDVVAMRRAIYGGELGWIDYHSDVAWDAYDRHSITMVVREGARLVASARLSIESEGPLEVSDLVGWRHGLPAALRGGLAAEWSRVMIEPAHRKAGLFRRMYTAASAEARVRGATLMVGASVAELRPVYASLGFVYLDLPFRSSFFAASPVYWPAYQEIA